MTRVTSLFLEEIVEGFFDIILRRAGTAAARVERHSIIGLEVVAKIRAIFVPHIVRLRFRTLIALARIEEATVFATIGIGFTMRTFILAPHSTDEFDFASTTMTNHNAEEDSKLRHNEATC